MALTKVGKEGVVGLDNSADATAVTIDSGENVAIGVTSKNSSNNGSLTIGHTGMTKITGSANGNADELVLIGADASANVGMSIISNNANISGIFFGDEDDTDIGRIEYYHSDNSMRFQTNTSEKLRVESGGDLSIIDGNLVVASGHGIDFSATANSGGSMSSELLDDYEEGTWTPTFTDGSNTGTLTSPSGFYTKIGNVVVADYSYSINGIGSLSGGSTAQVGGLPFTAQNDFVGGQGSVRSQGIGGANHLPIVAEVLQNTTNLRYHFASGDSTQLVVTVNQFSQSDFVAGQIIYKV